MKLRRDRDDYALMAAIAAPTMNFDGHLPYPSRRQPIFARNAVATSQPLATQAGIAMLQRGGNAVDAALATAIALTVVEPCSNGIGSDLFAILWDGRELIGLNASGRAPAAVTPQRYRGQTGIAAAQLGGGDDPRRRVGMGRRCRSASASLPFADLFVPAIRYARDGYAVSPVVAEKWAKAARSVAARSRLCRAFPAARPPAGRGGIVPLRADGRARSRASPPRAATRSIEASSRTRWSRTPRRNGALARAVRFRGSHGRLGRAAGARFRRDHGARDPSQRPRHRGADRARHPAGFDLDSLAPDSRRQPAPANRGDEARVRRRLSLRQRSAHDGASRPRRCSIPATSRRAPASSIRKRAQDFGPGDPPRGGTVYLCAADEQGMIVSLIQSNYMGFGSGVVVPGTGISMQNRGVGFSLVPGHPNEIGGGKRPFQTIIPGFLTRDGAPLAAFGVMGGPDPAARARADDGSPARCTE